MNTGLRASLLTIAVMSLGFGEAPAQSGYVVDELFRLEQPGEEATLTGVVEASNSAGWFFVSTYGSGNFPTQRVLVGPNGYRRDVTDVFDSVAIPDEGVVAPIPVLGRDGTAYVRQSTTSGDASVLKLSPNDTTPVLHASVWSEATRETPHANYEVNGNGNILVHEYNQKNASSPIKITKIIDGKREAPQMLSFDGSRKGRWHLIDTQVDDYGRFLLKRTMVFNAQRYVSDLCVGSFDANPVTCINVAKAPRVRGSAPFETRYGNLELVGGRIFSWWRKKLQVFDASTLQVVSNRRLALLDFAFGFGYDVNGSYLELGRPNGKSSTLNFLQVTKLPGAMQRFSCDYLSPYGTGNGPVSFLRALDTGGVAAWLDNSAGKEVLVTFTPTDGKLDGVAGACIPAP